MCWYCGPATWSLREMRGLAVSSDSLPVIVVNATDSPRGQVFTLAHEFIHLLLHQSGLCNLLSRTKT